MADGQKEVLTQQRLKLGCLACLEWNLYVSERSSNTTKIETAKSGCVGMIRMKSERSSNTTKIETESAGYGLL